MNRDSIFDYPLFALGFRAFFTLAGLSALMLILLWNAIYQGEFTVDNYFDPNLWHAHEMLLGYSSAVIAGFLLTAVRNWTGRPSLNGDQLAGLCLLWIYGRILPFYAGLLPDLLIAAVDFSFLPVLLYKVSQPIIVTKHQQGMVFLIFLALMSIANGLIHIEQLGIQKNSAGLGLLILVATIITMILVIAGRIFPFFTERGLSGTIAIRNPLLDNLSVMSGALVFLLLIFNVSGWVLALFAAITVISNLARIANWYVLRVWYVPLLWILYVGYAWIIIGFVMVGCSAFDWVPVSLSLHAFTLGGIGVLTLGMMARVSLGHTGRVLKASNAISIAFVLINISAFLRILMPLLLPDWYSQWVYFAALAWLAAFSLFVFIYSPVLNAPRVDGQPDQV